ncbi:hypothetical protein LXL04_000312 [Taraxacum kok-saghyz]
MANHNDINASHYDTPDQEWVLDSIQKAMPPPLSSARIPGVPKILMSETIDNYDKYYVPKVVSIGPYHYNNQKFEFVEKVKPVFTHTLLSKYNLDLTTLYKKLGESNMKAGSCRELRSHQIVFIQQDLFLLENQIPFKVINEVMSLIKLDCCEREKIESFFIECMLVSKRQKSWWCCFGSSKRESQESLMKSVPDHLLHRLHSNLTRTNVGTENEEIISDTCTFRNVSELVDVGINFKPSNVGTLSRIEFFPRWWWFSADLKLPPITIDESTKPMLLNLIAYEMCADDAHAWVTSYICLLDSLIDHPVDVKVLRKAGILDNSLGSDKQVATLFNEIGTDLVPNNLAYSKEKKKIQKHYESLRNTRFSQLKHEYIKSPWSFLALIGAVMALFLSAVQTYFTIWGRKGECEKLCEFLKKNHHL